MPLTLEQVQHIANLARLELTEAEIAHDSEQLSAILDYFQQLDGVDTENILPASRVYSAESTSRADQSRPGLNLDDLLKNAPDTRDRQFRVPAVFD